MRDLEISESDVIQIPPNELIDSKPSFHSKNVADLPVEPKISRVFDFILMQKTPEGRKDYSDGAILSIKAAKGDACPKRLQCRTTANIQPR
jgi:hypothetical protein